MTDFLTGAAILRNGNWHHGQGVLLAQGRIQAILPADAAPDARTVRLPAGSLLSPGLIDIQVNGGGGMLFNDNPTEHVASAIAAAHRRLGTTTILPTFITDTPARFAQALALQACPPGIAGLHLEGPFIGPQKPGVHRPEYIRAPDEDDLRQLEALAVRLSGKVLLTVAPETMPDSALRRLADAGVVLSIGHSDASFARTQQALAAGVTGFTHLFNAMPPLAARDPGPTAAALLHKESWCGVIADGVHVSEPMLRVLQAARGLARVILVSDSMPPAGTDLPGFTLQRRHIQRREGRLETADGTLAGADISLLDAVRCAVTLFGITLAESLTLATANPATYLGLETVGKIEPGMQADLLLLDQNAKLLSTWQAGRQEATADE